MAELQRTLSYKALLLIAINSIMGTGIFFLPALGAKLAGPASILSWILLSIMSIGIAMCFAELASMYPTSGGIYEYAKRAYGSFPSFIIGWGTVVAGNITIAMLVVGAIQYLNPAIPTLFKIGVSLFFVLSFNYIGYKGMQTSKVMLITFAFITLGSLLGIILPGIFFISTTNFTPFVVTPLPFIFITIFFIAETFFGWETVTFLAEETKDAEKNIPKVLIQSTFIIAAICILFVLTSMSILPWSELAESAAPLASLATGIYGAKGASIFAILVYLSIIGSVAGWIVSGPRLLLALAKDKLFLTQFAKIHPKYNTPYMAIIFQTILTSILVIVGAGSYHTLLNLLLPLVLILYSTVILALIILRKKHPTQPRGYKVPFGIPGCILLIFINIGLIAYWLLNMAGSFQLFTLMILFVIIGLPLYLLLVLYYNPEATIAVTSSLAYLNAIFENFTLSKKIRKELLAFFPNLKGKKVLEYGAGVGTLTKHIADAVGDGGVVFATDISQKNVKLLKKRMEYRKIKHVNAIVDEHQFSRVHPDIENVEVIFSVGMLSYIQDLEHVLKDMNRILPEDGKILFVEYVDYFWGLIPNPQWLATEENIKKAFRKAGFSVKVERKPGLFWKYLYVIGMKSDEDVPFI
ncbi:hypothetical protein CMO92_01655 [Candidatus Woesearchaeota archaeon]|nr:hypothetical protein [Candidatus Woesearchaeota archaeon]